MRRRLRGRSSDNSESVYRESKTSKLEKIFEEFIKTHGGELKSESYLPMSVGQLMNEGKCTVDVYSSEDKWYGVTYQEDREDVVKSLAALKAEGKYPESLNK